MAESAFEGQEGTLTLDGEVTTGLVGADYGREDWLTGLVVSQTDADGSYTDDSAGSGTLASSLTAVTVYGAMDTSARTELWGAAGHGQGELTLTPAADSRAKADLDWTMAAAGARNVLAEPSEGDGLTLALVTDALWARTTSDAAKVGSLVATEVDVTRLRLGVEGSWAMALEGGGAMTPALELGLRHDGGDAETGFGVELGGGLTWNDPALGLSLDLSGRTLLAHEDENFKDRGVSAGLAFDPDPASERGLSFTLRHDLGGESTGGLDALFGHETLGRRTGAEADSRWTAEATWGFPAFGGRYTGQSSRGPRSHRHHARHHPRLAPHPRRCRRVGLHPRSQGHPARERGHGVRAQGRHRDRRALVRNGAPRLGAGEQAMKIAIDAQILMRNHARRMVLGAAECAGATVVLPETAATMATLSYHRVAARYVKKVVVWDAHAAGEPLDDEVLGRRIQERMEKTTEGFAHWIEDEQRRNDGVFERAPRTKTGEALAWELSLNHVVDDPRDTRWGIGEDPYVIAEALEAGAHWIASDNFKTLHPQAMEDWLDRVQEQGRYTHVPRPFMLSGEKAVDMMLAHTPGWTREPTGRALQRVALAHALSEPNDPTTRIARRIGILGRFAQDLLDCAMSIPGGDLERWQMHMYAMLEQGHEDAAWAEIGQLKKLRPTTSVTRTRVAEDRRIRWERSPPESAAGPRTRRADTGGTGR